MSEPILETLDLEKHYGAARALERQLSQVREGEIFGLLGPNGAGKTTLLSIVAGLLEPTWGMVRLAGKPLGSDPALKKLIGVVPQELALHADLTARENLAFFGALYGMAGEALRSSVVEVLDAVGLADRADERVRTYSGGMQRRLNLGAALVHRPRLLLLDEPTVGVDPQSRHRIFEEVRRRNAAGVTVVYTSHYMEEVQALCTRVGILDHGKLIACDTLAGLLALLEGEIRLRVRDADPRLLERLNRMPDARADREKDGRLLIRCRDVQRTLVHLVGLLNDHDAELTGLEIQEPNLERVFLHLTHAALRD